MATTKTSAGRRKKRRSKESPDTPESAVTPKTGNLGRWRAATLLFVYVLMALHVAHWKITGKTLAPLELNEVMYTLELGIVTAGFIFMVVAFIATAIFGRFFCSWGCHILALQDLSAWLLGKLGIKPRPIRSRLLLWVPLIAAAYMFVWPQISRIAVGEPMATLHLATDADGWASFTTENFWRNLPGPGVAIGTFLVCGFLIIYVLGTRSFCSYGCPYGAVFGIADRIAPGRIRVGKDCIQCATCTSVCTSNVRVHEEVERYGMIVNPACMKDLDCVTACPQQTLGYAFGRPSLLKQTLGSGQVKKIYDFTLSEECLAAVVFLAGVLVFRGLYGVVPFLMSLAIAAILSYGAVVLSRLVRRPDFSLKGQCLRREGRLTALGGAFLACSVATILFIVHSGVVRYSMFMGERLYHGSRSASPIDDAAAESGINHLSRAQSWGLVSTGQAERMIGDLHAARGNLEEAVSSRRRTLLHTPNDPAAREQLASVLSKMGRHEEARKNYLAVLDSSPERVISHYGLAGVEFRAGNSHTAIRHLKRAIAIDPDFAEAHYELGAILVETGAIGAGIEQLKECIRLNPDHGDARYNLAVAYALGGRLAEAKKEIARAYELKPDDPQVQMFREKLIRAMSP